jgi:hypothetical protein
MRSDVVLPQPDGPSSEKNSPAAMSSVIPSTATTLPSKVLVTSSSRMAAEVSAQLFKIFVTRASMSSLRSLYHFQSGWISVPPWPRW